LYAVIETVTITDFDKARDELQKMLPGIKQTPGFVGGYFLAPTDGTGMSVTAYESEDAANAVKEQMQPGTKLNDYVTVKTVEVREIVANL
jgi:hypothetical protein